MTESENPLKEIEEMAAECGHQVVFDAKTGDSE